MPKRFVFFWDIDGTLLTTQGLGRRPLLEAIKEEINLDFNYDFSNTSGLTDHQIVGKILNYLGINENDGPVLTTKILENYCIKYEKLMPTSQIVPLNNSSLVLTYLSEVEEVENWICTGNIKRGAMLKLQSAGLLKFFKEKDIFCSENLEPRFRIIERATRIAEIQDLTPFVIGDTVHDIEASKQMGLACIALESGDYPIQDLLGAKPNHVLRLGWGPQDLMRLIHD